MTRKEYTKLDINEGLGYEQGHDSVEMSNQRISDWTGWPANYGEEDQEVREVGAYYAGCDRIRWTLLTNHQVSNFRTAAFPVLPLPSVPELAWRLLSCP